MYEDIQIFQLKNPNTPLNGCFVYLISILIVKPVQR